MPTLESLKAEHPEWCWKCGCSVRDTVHSMDPHCDTISDDEGSPVISALTSAKLEDEATIREQQRMIQEADRILAEAGERVGCYFGSDTADEMANKIRELEGCLIAEQEHTAHVESQLSAEQAAHAATKEELRKVDEALDMAIHKPWQWGSDQEAVYTAALARQARRAAETKETK